MVIYITLHITKPIVEMEGKNVPEEEEEEEELRQNEDDDDAEREGHEDDDDHHDEEQAADEDNGEGVEFVEWNEGVNSSLLFL